MLIDYGFPQNEYYHPQRNSGTLMGHYRHRAHADPFLWPGLSDLTAHVDFTAMAQAGVRGGLHVAGYTSLAAFLVSAGILHCLAAWATRRRRIMCAKPPPCSACCRRRKWASCSESWYWPEPMVLLRRISLSRTARTDCESGRRL